MVHLSIYNTLLCSEFQELIEIMCHYACGGSFRWCGSEWLPQGGWANNWEAAPLCPFSPQWFSFFLMQWCSVWLALSSRLKLHNTKMFQILSGLFWLHLDLVLGSGLWGAPVRKMWTPNLVMYTGVESAVVWLGWVAVTFEVPISRNLVLIWWICNPNTVLFRSIGPLSSLGLPHILLGVLTWGDLFSFLFLYL